MRNTENCFPSLFTTLQKVSSFSGWENLIQAITEGHLKTFDHFLYYRNTCILGRKKRTSIPFPSFSMRIAGHDKDSYLLHILIIIITTLTILIDL